MLIMFRVKNFTSFKDDAILDMRAVSYKTHKSHVIENGKNKLVKTLAIFGKNASGKSNLVSAMYCFESLIFNQMFWDNDREDENKLKGRKPNIKRKPFLLNGNQNEEIEFEIIFNFNDVTYQYGFSVEKEIIKTEWLLVNDNEVFDRGEILRKGKKYEKELKDFQKIREDRLFLATLDYFGDGFIKNIINEIKLYLGQHFTVHFELIIEMSVKGIISGLMMSKRTMDDKEYLKSIEKFIINADVGIEGIVLEKKDISEQNDIEEKYDIKTIHNVYNDQGEITGNKEFDMDLESSGTIRYFAFIQYILDILDKGGVFIVDEISARLHPVLTKYIIDLFQSSRNTKAQLIFTTHDISLMNKEQFRRDEIAFVDKNEKGESSIYSLADLKTRSDASYLKDYLYGKYGAIPIIKEESIL